MFNNNKKTPEPMNSDNSGKNIPSVNMISEDTHLEGKLETKNDIRIAGTLDGEANAKGRVIISSSGKINGNIQAVDADIAGRIDGEIRVTGKLVLRKSAIIEGDIYTKTILAEEGAQINGSFHMSNDIKSEMKTKNLSDSLSNKKNQKESKPKEKVKKS